MLLQEVEYARATSIEDALDLLGEHDDARALAGGQTLVNVLKLRIAGPSRLVDITRVPELRGVRTSADGGLDIGAATTYAELTEAVDVWAVRPVVAEVAAIIADVQVRNRGTIGGNACLNLPTNHFPPVLVALGAELIVTGRDGERAVPAEQFFESPFTTAVQTGELLTRIRIPALPAGGGDAFVAMAAGRESQSIVHVAVSLRVATFVEEARIAVGCVGPKPVRTTAVEAALVGTRAGADDARAAVEELGASLSPTSDVNATADFKRHVAEVLVERAVLRAAERSRGDRG
jgi:aerobic carbon-monoxide dehydrogenase medium subunit